MLYNFIIVDDSPFFLNQITQLIKTITKEKNLIYNIYTFQDYDQKTYRFLNKKLQNSIFILDIETEHSNGIQFSKKIRDNDIQSPIILMTAYRDKYQDIILEEELLTIGTLSKEDKNFENKMTKKIEYAVNIMNFQKNIRFSYKNTCFTLKLNELLYITTNPEKRGIIIKTIYSTICTSNSLKEIVSLFDEKLTQTHGSCFINLDNVKKIKYTENKITFITGETIDLLSRNFKKDIKKKLKQK